MFKKFSIQNKIVFPYTLLFAVVIVSTSLITISVVHKLMDKRIERQMERMAEAISGMGFLLSDDFLSGARISEVTGADIIIYKQDGEVTATTLQRDRAKEAMAAIKPLEVDAAISQLGDKPLIRNTRYQDQPYKVIYRRLEMPDEKGSYQILSLMSSTADIYLAKRRFAVTTGLVAISGIILVAAIGSIIAGNITAPVKQLVGVTEKIAAGDLTAEALVRTRDEVGALANSFNQMTRELKISRDRLVQSEKLAAVGQIAAGIAHEIRNPLASIKMIVQLLGRRIRENETGRESVQAVLDEINRLEIIINDLLDFARPMELVLKPSNLARLVDDVLKIMSADLRHRRIELVSYLDDALPEVTLDPNRVKQVFMNLILNSMQAMPDGGKLIVRSHYDRENRAIQVEVEDTGLGMTKEVLDRAFEPFFSTKPGGTGLGLSNVKKVTEQHGGSVSLESKEGQGTKAIIRFGVVI